MVRTTKEQRQAIYRKWRQDSQTMTYRQFRQTAQSTFFMDDAIVIPWCAMWLAIERDGHTHT